MEVKIVLGHAFGDEGKGVTVQYLCQKALNEGKNPLVIRFSGGPQAAHTIQNGNITHICSSFGSGVLLGVPTFIAPTAYFDPISAQKEWGELVNKMGNIYKVPPLYVSYDTKVITPYDVMSGRNNAKVIKDGTCGKGIYPTFKRNNTGECEALLGDFVDYHQTGNINYPLKKLHEVRDYYKSETDVSLENRFSNAITYTFFKPVFNNAILDKFNVLIFEGSQGLLLDAECGYYPNVTPSLVGLNGIPTEFLKEADLYLVTRTYLTRHGNGYIPKTKGFDFDLSKKFETNIFNEYQGQFKVGTFDFDILHDAISRHRIDNQVKMYNIHPNLVITHFDVLPEKGKFPFYLNNNCTFIEYENKAYVADLIRHYSSIDFKEVYINDSPRSNLIKFKTYFNYGRR